MSTDTGSAGERDGRLLLTYLVSALGRKLPKATVCLRPVQAVCGGADPDDCTWPLADGPLSNELRAKADVHSPEMLVSVIDPLQTSTGAT